VPGRDIVPPRTETKPRHELEMQLLCLVHPHGFSAEANMSDPRGGGSEAPGPGSDPDPSGLQPFRPARPGLAFTEAAHFDNRIYSSQVDRG
jgi:hypothetical protein